MQPNWVSEKNHTTSPHTKKMQPLDTQNHATSQQKHCKNRKTLSWEYHIGCQMCKIVLSKSGDTSDSSEKNHTTSPQKNHAIFFFYFLSTLGKCNLTHLTTDVMFSGQRFAILAMFPIKKTTFVSAISLCCPYKLYHFWTSRLN